MATLFGTNNNDTLVALSNHNEIQGLGGDDQITGNNGKSKLFGQDGNDWISGGTGKDELDGGDGNDTLLAGAGNDRLIGGVGLDTASYATSSNGVIVSLVTGTGSGGDANGDELTEIENLTGSNSVDTLTGNSGANVLAGLQGNDTLAGNSGDDSLDGGDGSDSMDGGANNDILNGGLGADRIVGGLGVDTASYANAALGVTVSLVSGLGSAGEANGDVLTDIENLTGSAHADVLTGNSGANVLQGLNGGDTLAGGANDDSLDGGNGDDSLAGGSGSDDIAGGAGNDTANYGASSLAVTVNLEAGNGTGGDAQGDNLSSIENVVGSDFDDTFKVSSAANVINGGGGADKVDFSAETSAITIDLLTGKGSGGDTFVAIENVDGSDLDDKITGNGAANILAGGLGADSLDGGDGSDTIKGGSGDDRLTGGNGSDSLDGGAGIDTIDYRYSTAGVQITVGGSAGVGGDAQDDTLSGVENLSGSNFDDTLGGDNSANRLVGRQGADQLSGGGGDDMLVGGGGYDHQDGGSGTDTVDYSDSWGLVFVDLLKGEGSGAEAANDTFASIENIIGSDFDDRITGSADNNRLNGMAGADTLDGGNGNDVLVGGAGADAMNGGGGARDAADYQNAASAVSLNLATGGSGGEAAGDTFANIEFVYGSGFNDSITGDDAINRLVGNGGADTLDGGIGNDYLVGGAGSDSLTGGQDADVFIFEGAFGNDTISDFWSGPGRTDRIWLQDTGLNSFVDVLANATQTGAGVVIDIAGHGVITLLGANLGSLTADDFLFG